MFSVKNLQRMELHFMKGTGSRSDLQVAISGQENKVVGTESDNIVESGPEKSFVHG